MTNATAEQTVRASVNEKAFFASLKHIFGSSFSVLRELMQNARRAGASRVAFDFDPQAKSLTITDDGHGIKDFSTLIDLCTSGWDDAVVAKDNPFGMGFFSLFSSCETVTVRSQGKRLTMAQDDIANKRHLPVVSDDLPVDNGTVIHMAGLVAKLLESSYGSTLIEQHLAANAAGFAIEVAYNGKVLPRPYAMDQLSAAVTPQGAIHVIGIHGAGTKLHRAIDGNTKFFLQGLPIEDGRRFETQFIVHLDGQLFKPVMPDRLRLHDAKEHLQQLYAACDDVVREHLAQEKTNLAPKEFLGKYWNACKEFKVAHLLNDIPFVPVDIFEIVNEVSMNRDDLWTTPQPYRGEAFYPREAFASGEFKIWTDVPDDVQDDVHAIGFLSVMAHGGVLGFSDGLHESHWLNEFLVSCVDLTVSASPGAVKASTRIAMDAAYVTVRMVDEVNLAVTHESDPDYRVEVNFTDTWAGLYEEGTGQVCYLTAGETNIEAPVPAYDDFRDENGDYDYDVENRTRVHWSSMVAAIRGDSVAMIVDQGISQMSVSFTDALLGKAAMVFPYKVETEQRQIGPFLRCVDLEAVDRWDALADRLQQHAGAKSRTKAPRLTGDALKTMFKEVFEVSAVSDN